MKAITVCQPYAWLIVHGCKTIENRSWSTSYRGPLVIHAGKSHKYMGAVDELRPLIERMPPKEEYRFGCILGVVTLRDCVPFGHSSLYRNRWAEGPVCWRLSAPRLTSLEPYRGERGLFDIPDTLIDRLLGAAGGCTFSAPALRLEVPDA